MSTEENTPIDTTVTENLDDFAAELFGESVSEPSGDAKPEETEELSEQDSDAPIDSEDTQDSADEGATESEGEEPEEEEEPTETDEGDDAPKKVNRFQERINEVTAARRAAEREAEAERQLRINLEKRLQELEKTVNPEPEKPVVQETPELKAPQPTDTNEDGSDKYPLGEFDPAFLRDTVQHLFNQKEQEQKAAQEEARKQQEITQQRAPLQEAWNQKLVDAQERYPDFQEKGQQMIDVFDGIDEQYGQYLTDTLMEMDAGPDVFYYLSNNLDEAKDIVNAGPRKATIALAKLEAQLTESTNKAPRVKPTKAPPPPPQVKGSAVAKATVPLDTDDLEAFTKELWRK
jgi:hypothetical protein